MKKITIKELREICYPEEKKINDPIFVRLFVRKFSIYFSRIFILYKITANSVTLISLVVSLIGCFFIGFKSSSYNLFGVLLLHLGYIFDCCDGEVARFQNDTSINGMFLDLYCHYLIVPLIFFSFGIHLLQILDNIFFLIIGTLAGIVSMGIAKKVKFGVIEDLIYNSKEKNFYCQYFDDLKVELENVSSEECLKNRAQEKMGKRIFSTITKLDKQIFRHHMFLNFFSLFVIGAFLIPEIYIAIIYAMLSLAIIIRELTNFLLMLLSDNVKYGYLITLKKAHHEFVSILSNNNTIKK